MPFKKKIKNMEISDILTLLYSIQTPWRKEIAWRWALNIACVLESLCVSGTRWSLFFVFIFGIFFCVFFFLLWVFYTLKIYVVLLLSWCGTYTLTNFFMFQSLFSAMDTPCFCHPYNCLWMVQKRGRVAGHHSPHETSIWNQSLVIEERYIY